MLGMHSLMLHCESGQAERKAVGSVELRVKKKSERMFLSFRTSIFVFLLKIIYNYNALLPLQQALLHDQHKCHI